LRLCRFRAPVALWTFRPQDKAHTAGQYAADVISVKCCYGDHIKKDETGLTEPRGGDCRRKPDFCRETREWPVGGPKRRWVDNTEICL